MPCPEVRCDAGGLGRSPHGKLWYERNGLRETSAEIAKEQAAYARQLVDSGCKILAIIGMEFSPACAPTYLNRGPVIHKDRGIFIEELQDELRNQGLDIPFVGVNQRWLKKLDKDLRNLLEPQVELRELRLA